MDNTQRGEIAESEFVSWCARAFMIASRSQPDLFGWDYLVTLRRSVPHDGPDETKESERECKAQVKAATPDAWSVSISVTNWERMVKQPFPWFVAVFRFPVDATAPSEAFLVHVEKEHVAKLLERLRRHDTEEDGTPLNKLTLDLAFSATDRISGPAEMRQRIESHLGPSAAEYARVKDEWRNAEARRFQAALVVPQGTNHRGFSTRPIGRRYAHVQFVTHS